MIDDRRLTVTTNIQKCTFVLSPTWISKLHIYKTLFFRSYLKRKFTTINVNEWMTHTKQFSLLLDTLVAVVVVIIFFIFFFNFYSVVHYLFVFFSSIAFAWTHEYSARGFLLRHNSLITLMQFAFSCHSDQFSFFFVFFISALKIDFVDSIFILSQSIVWFK